MSLKLKYKSTHKASPLPSPTKVKGKVQRLCTQYCTFRTKIPIAAYDLAPQTEMTTVCLVFCINPSSMSIPELMAECPALHCHSSIPIAHQSSGGVVIIGFKLINQFFVN